ncbi:MAG: GntR family transcriptional regulator [Phycisphaerae bacterium]
MHNSAKTAGAVPRTDVRRRLGRPKYRMVYDTLLQSIRRGDYPPGHKLPAETELMAQFNVSRITVIRALRDLQNAGVVRRRHGSGSYVEESRPPNLLRVGLLFPRLLEPDSIFTVVHQTLTRESQKHGWLILFQEISDKCTPERALNILEQFAQSGVRGVLYLPLPITAGYAEVNEAVSRYCVEWHLALVLLDRDIHHWHNRSRFDLIGSDNEIGGFLAAQHLIQRGCRRIMFFGGTWEHPTVEARLEGVRHAIARAASVHLEVPSTNGEDPVTIQKLLSQHSPDGIVCANDLTAAKLLRSLFQSGMQVPEQVKLVGFDDTPTACLLPVPLTTIRQAADEMAIQAMNVMRQRLSRPEMPTITVSIACTLVERASSAPHPSPAIHG